MPPPRLFSNDKVDNSSITLLILENLFVLFLTKDCFSISFEIVMEVFYQENPTMGQCNGVLAKVVCTINYSILIILCCALLWYITR